MAPSEGEARAFQAVRPLCVTLLRHTAAPSLAKEAHATLAQLANATRAAQADASLQPALIHYIFYPLSQLLRMRDNGLYGLPDRVRELTFDVLGTLARDWWRAWTWDKVQNTENPAIGSVQAWQVWEQLLLLSAMALSANGTDAEKNSDATVLAIARFLTQLLQPRQQAPREERDWEWDGVSDLPSLDAMDEDGNESLTIQIYPCAQHTNAARGSRTCVGALSHLLKLAMDTAREPARPASLRTAMIDVATATGITWLGGDTQILHHGPAYAMQETAAYYATPGWDKEAVAVRTTPILPGVVSSMLKIVAGHAAPGPVVARALTLLTATLVACLADVVTAPLRTPPPAPPTVHRLEAFAHSEDESDSDMASVSDVDTPATSVADSEAPIRDAQWLQRSMRPVLIALFTLDLYQTRDYAEAEHALIDCAASALQLLPDTLTQAWHDAVGEPSTHDPLHRLLRMLLDLASAARRRNVMEHARAAISGLVERAPALWLGRLGQELVLALESLPGAVRGVRDTDVVHHAERVGTIAEMTGTVLAKVQLEHANLAFLAEFRSASDVRRWSEALMNALSIHDRMAPADADEADGLGLRPQCPPLEHGSVEAIGRMLYACGSAVATLLVGAARGGATVRYHHAFAALLAFVQDGCKARTASGAAQRSAIASLYAANEHLRGLVAEISTPELEAYIARNEGRGLRKPVHALARFLTQQILGAWNDDRDEEHAPDLAQDEKAVATTEDTAPEMVRGMPNERDNTPRLEAGKALDVAFVDSVRLDHMPAAAPERRVEQRVALGGMGDALLLAMLAGAAALLGAQFRPQLLHALYPVLSACGSEDRVVQTTARHALDRIAEACAYPNAASCVLHHADYVLGAASHRLVAGLHAELRAGLTQMQLAQSMRGARMHSSLLGARAAPWVLVQVLEMLGSEVLPLVEDAVDEVLDALDRFHGYDDVCDGLLAVLARVLHVLAAEQPPAPQAPPAKTERDPVADLVSWLAQRAAPEEPTDAPIDEDPNEDPNPPAARREAVVAQIVSRCVPFLSHASPILRARALAMLADGVCILASAQRTADLYPVLHRAWPMIMARLGMNTTQRRTLPHLRGHDAQQRLREALPSEQDANVWMQATSLIGTISTYASDVFGKMVVEQAWPRWARLLYVLEQLTAARPHARALPSGAQGDGALAPKTQHTFRVYDVHGTLGQVLLAILASLRALLVSRGERVPSDVVWAMATHPVLVDTLDARQPAAVSQAGLALYRAMAHTDANLVWVVLRAVASDAAPAYLRRDAMRLVPLAPIWT